MSCEAAIVSEHYLYITTGRSWYTCERMGIAEARVYSCDWLSHGKEIHSASPRFDALQSVINSATDFFAPWLPPLCYTRLQSTPQQFHANSWQYRSTRMSSATSDRTAAPHKMHHPATSWTFFTKDNFEFGNFVGRSRADLKKPGALSPEAEQAQKTLRTTESAARKCTNFSTDLGENCILKHS